MFLEDGEHILSCSGAPQTRCRAGLVSHCRLRLSEQPRSQQGIQRTLFSTQGNTSSWVPGLGLQCAWGSLCPLFLLLRFTTVYVVVPVQLSSLGALTQIPICQRGPCPLPMVRCHYGQWPRSCPSKTDPFVFVPDHSDVIMNLSSQGLLLEPHSRALDGATGIAVGTSEHFC